MEKQMTMDELKSTINEAVQTSDLANQVNEVKQAIDGLKASKQMNGTDRAEKSAGFIRALVKSAKGDDVDLKTITTNTASFGYSIPVELAAAIHEKKDKIAKIRKYAFVFAMDGKFDLPVESTGVTGYWVTTEADADVTESNPTLTKAALDDFYMAARVRVPYKLMNSTPISIENFVTNLASRALRNLEETAFVAGAGTTQPTGLRTASIGSVPQASTSLVYNDLVNLYYTLAEQYREGAVFLTSTAGMKLIRGLKDTYGMPIFNVEKQTLFDKPLLESADIPANLGSGGDTTEIYFGDLKEYWIKDGETMLSEVRTVPGRLQVDVMVYAAVDGCLVNTDGFKKLTAVK